MLADVESEVVRSLSDGGDDEEELDGLSRLRVELVDRFAPRGWTPCHAAAAAGRDGRLVVLPGASGSGKSTVAVLLACHGYAVADELVFLRAVAGGIEAMVPPLPLSLPEEALHGFPEAASWRLGPGESPNGKESPGGKVLLKPPALLAGAGRVAAIVLLERNGAWEEISLRDVPRAEASKALFENIARFSGGGPEYAAMRRRVWRTFCALLDHVPIRALRGDVLSNARAVPDRIEEALGGGQHVR